MSQPASVPFGGTYELRFALRGLRYQLLPFGALAFGLVVLAAACAPLSLAIAVLLLGGSAVVVYFVTVSYTKERRRAEARPPHGDVTGELSPLGLILRSGEIEEKRAWSEFARAQMFPSVILLHNHDGSIVLIPAEFFDLSQWPHAKRIVASSPVAARGALPSSLKLALGALVAALVLFYTLRLLR